MVGNIRCSEVPGEVLLKQLGVEQSGGRPELGQQLGKRSHSGQWSGTSYGKYGQRDHADWRPHSDRLTALSFALLIWMQTLVNGCCLMLPILGIFVHRSGGRSSVRGTIAYRPGKQNSDRRDGGQGPPWIDATVKQL
ncbi:hypothetical protein MAP00_007791 [Monascus purpureus]|nr:hypothetical protein MAP00_007791 [Monascus purpureus]